MTKYVMGKVIYLLMSVISLVLAFTVTDTIEEFGLCIMLSFLSSAAVLAIEQVEKNEK
jgi:hypothetical protein